ncbi:MAG: hypothetical protein WD342_13260 [Verrucomicrobiales bacterium]
MADQIPGERPSGKRVTEGPWGKLEYYEVTLEPPTSHLWDALYTERSFWNFGKIQREEAVALFHAFRFSPSLVDLIEAEGRWTETKQGLELDITDRIVETMTPENRAAIARWFRKNSDDFFSRLLINLEAGDTTAMYDRLKPGTVDLVNSVSFRRGRVLSVMDRPYLLSKLGNDEDEKKALIHSLFSTRALVARLVVDDISNIEALTDYWSAGGKNPGVRAILGGVKAAPGVEHVDMVHLLPPVARKYLSGFISLQDVNPSNTPDCFWAALQFFKSTPSPRVLDPLGLDHYLGHDFEEVPGERTFGDVVCIFKKEDGDFLHSYVHVADDIVFTKNGASFARPLILTLKSYMMSVYQDEDQYFERTFRRKVGT